VDWFKVFYFVNLVVKDFPFQQIKNLVLIAIKLVQVVSIVEITSHVYNAIQSTIFIKMEVNVNALQIMHKVRPNVYLALHYLAVQLVLIFIHAPNVLMAQVLIYKMVNVNATAEVHLMADHAFHALKSLAV